MFKLFTDWSARRQAVRELSRLSDRALADLGIRRADIQAVASLAAEHGADETYETPRPYNFRDGDAFRPAWAAFHPASLAA